jgi:hypothetical protein
MKILTVKKLAFLLSLSTLIWNISPIFAQTLEVEILGGGYKLRGPATINFATISASKNDNQSTLNFVDLGSSDRNYLEIIDENGGNPFDVTVGTSPFIRSELLDTNIAADSTTTSIKVTSSTGFFEGDNFTIVGTDLGNRTITGVPDSTTIEISPALSSPPAEGQIFRRVVDCNLNSKKCIPLKDFSIANNDTQTAVTVVNGSGADLTMSTQTDTQKAFGGSTTTIAGSTGSTLKVADSSVFDIGEDITFGNPAAVTPEAVPTLGTVASIDDPNTITLAAPFSTSPIDGVTVASTSSRSLTLVNGSGAAPSDIKIYPQIQMNISAGQMPGTYETTLNFTII